MKKFLAVLVMSLLFLTAVRAQEKANWKEMEDFHSVMAATFHPAEEGNLQPIRTRSLEMRDKAIAWKKSDAPAGYDKKAVRSGLKKLTKGAKEIDQLVKSKATNQELVTKLTTLHDVFHEIMEKCSKETHH